MAKIDPQRVTRLNDIEYYGGPVIYWMSRDQRVYDNWALLYAQEQALAAKAPLYVIFCLVPKFIGAALRQYHFMIEGLEELARKLAEYQVPFYLLLGDPAKEIPSFVEKQKAGMLVCDFSPLKISRGWQEKVAADIKVPFHQVDAHNIVPCRVASGKKEYGARTIRPKINKLLDTCLVEMPRLILHQFNNQELPGHIDWQQAYDSLEVNASVGVVRDIKAGETAAMKKLNVFLTALLPLYNQWRNDPNRRVQSGLSPYLHFGQISAQRVALEVQRHEGDEEGKAAFLEELIIRRELAENFCFYDENYDNTKCFHDWAQKTLDAHRGDKREYTYSKGQFESYDTHDDLWNAAQAEMVKSGRMQGYMRMYWAKKILEWTESPEEAMEIAIYLNDKYELDGRDPNGYAGVAWSVGGVHDRAWTERKVFGKIRYMNEAGCRRKFDVDAYIEYVREL